MKKKIDPITLKRENDEAKFGFIIAELDLAATFCERASTTSDSTKAERNLNHALRAYGSAIRFAKGAELTPERREQIREKIVRLDAILHASFYGTDRQSQLSPGASRINMTAHW